MRILYDNQLIASGDPAHLCLGPAGMSFSGTPVVDAFRYLQAEYATVFGRGDGPVEFGFSVLRGPFSSQAELLAFVSTHREVLSNQADLVLVDDDETVAYTMADAVRQVGIAEVIGLSVRVDYRFIGSRFQSDDVPEAPLDSNTVKAINATLDAGDVEKVITFETPFASPPRGITLQLSGPDGGPTFALQVRESSRTAAGFTVDLAVPATGVPASGYKITGLAVL